MHKGNNILTILTMFLSTGGTSTAAVCDGGLCCPDQKSSGTSRERVLSEFTHISDRRPGCFYWAQNFP